MVVLTPNSVTAALLMPFQPSAQPRPDITENEDGYSSKGYMRCLVEYLSRCGVGRSALEAQVSTAHGGADRVKLKCYPLDEFCAGEGANEEEATEEAARKVLDVLDGKQLLEARGRRLNLMLRKYGGNDAVVANGGNNMKDLVEKSKDVGSPFYTLLEDAADDEGKLQDASLLVLQSLMASPTAESLYEDATAFLRKLGGSMPPWVMIDKPPACLLGAVHWCLLAVITGQVDGVVPQSQEVIMPCLLALEHVYLSWAAEYPGFSQFSSELVRYMLVTRKAPMLAKTRLECYELQSLPSEAARDIAVPYRQIACTDAEDADNELELLAEDMFPRPERIDWLHQQFNEVNEILMGSPLGVGGRVYGSLVNGFPTAHSDIDVAVELREEVKEELLTKQIEAAREEAQAEGSGLSDREEDNDKEMTTKARDRKATIAAIELLGEEFDKRGYVVNEVVSARVPILLLVKEFTGPDGEREKVEFNLSFDHEITLYNSRLLRCYAMLRPEVRSLVVLVKHWAKTRDVNDALNGTFSSYSYVLLVIFFLQQKGILPSLQDPRCFRDVKSEWIVDRYVDSNQHHVYFFDWLSTGVTDPQEALSRFFLPEYAHKSVPSLSRLLYEFFDFYTEVFPSYESVVDVRSIGPPVSKEDYFKTELVKLIKRMEKCGSSGGDDDSDEGPCPTLDTVMGLRRRRAWLSIADPFEDLRLLGVSPRGMERLMQEMKRALALLDHPKPKVSWIERLFSTQKVARGKKEFNHPRKAIDRAAHNWGTYHDNSVEGIRTSFIYYNSSESAEAFCRNPELDDAATWMAVNRAWTWATRGVPSTHAMLRFDVFCCLTMLEGVNVTSIECVEALPGHKLINKSSAGDGDEAEGEVMRSEELSMEVVCNIPRFQQDLANARTMRRSAAQPPTRQRSHGGWTDDNSSRTQRRDWGNRRQQQERRADPDYDRPETENRGKKAPYQPGKAEAPQVNSRDQDTGANLSRRGFHVKSKHGRSRAKDDYNGYGGGREVPGSIPGKDYIQRIIIPEVGSGDDEAAPVS
ncbi:hypothetical protein FOZ61_009819 [Perkinsus olseni]|uniref:Uncharacterized protein n=1 Tax=Perkinsus olseni TaxID=32597 RepID=A0A7J6KYN5_PEROL|nr:hypothetical protein FOZ61_009819 [Perkinsus olseni]